MLGRLLKFELGLQSRQVGFWVTVITMFLLGLVTPWATDAFGSGLAGEKLKVNGAQIIAAQIVSWDTAAIFFGAIFVVTGILRDKTYKFLEIIHSTPVSTEAMTGSRMIGIYLTVLLCIFANTVGLFIGQFAPMLDKEVLGPINPIFYVQPMLLFTVFNALTITAFFTLIAGIWQNRMLVFVSAIGLLFYSIVTGLVTELDTPRWVEAIVDPFASLAYSLETEFWAIDDRNTKLTPALGYVGLNRLVWAGISLLILAGVFKRFKRGLSSGKTKLDTVTLIDPDSIADYRPAKVSSGFAGQVRALAARTKFEYIATTRSIPFYILAGLAATLFALFIIITVFFAPQKLVPTSRFMMNIGYGSLFVPVMLIIVFFSGEMIWRDRTARFTELLDSTAVRNLSLLLAKWIALSAILATLCLIAIAVGMIVQILAGGTPINVSLYFKFSFLNVFPNYLALAFLALFVHTFAPNRIVGMLFAAAAIAGVSFISNVPFYHPLMGFSGTSPGPVSEISPYGRWIHFRWFNLYFGSLCALFAIIGTWLWRRGLQVSLLQRIKELPRQINVTSSSIAVGVLAVFIGSGVHIYKAYDKVDWRNRKTREANQAEMEKLMSREVKLPIPRINSVSVDADIYPSRQEALVKGHFVMKNTHETPITELYVNPASSHAEDNKRLEIEDAVRITDGQNLDGDNVEEFEKAGTWLYKFDPPLAPNAETVMSFETFFHSPRLADGSAISKNGTFLNNYGGFGASSRALPTLGAPDLRLRDQDKRRKYDLPEFEKRPERDDIEARQRSLFFGASGYIDFAARVCTQANQIPIAPGDLIEETLKDGRRCRTYKSDTPINNFYSFLSGDYTVTKDSWENPEGKTIPIDVYHAKQHDYSVDNMIQSVQFGLSHYTAHFSPYQYNYVRIMEVPFIGFAQAFAGTIPYAETGFVMSSGDPADEKSLDNAAQTTLHEMAHQWFAHQIVPSDTRGNNVLSEGLTSYAALDAYEAMFNWDKARYALEKATIDPMIALMFVDKNKEVPLAIAGEQQYLVYNKADWVLWSLKHYIGPEKVRLAMRNFIRDYGSKGAPYPTTKELTGYLREVAGLDYDQLITDQWDRITYWDLSYGDEDVKISANSDGTFKVEIPFKLEKKISTEENSMQTSVLEIEGETLNEWVEFGIYGNNPKDKWSDWIALEKRRVSQAESTLTFNVDQKPSFIALDPRRLLQERNVTDNIKTLGDP